MSQPDDSSMLSAAQERALASVLDEIIPRSEDGALPGAGELGLTAHLADVVAESPFMREPLVQGLADLDTLAQSRASTVFADLAAPDRLEVLNELVLKEPGFLPGLIFHTYTAYYRNPRVIEALGLEARPPYPKGYPLERGDLTLLDPVRKRPKSYRSPP